jgi:hypothetical protein
MAQMLLKTPEREEINEIKGLNIERSKEGLKSLLLEAIESSRQDKIFKNRCRKCKTND